MTWTNKNPQPGDKASPYATGEDFCRVFETLPDTFPVGSFEPPDIPGAVAIPNLTDFPELPWAGDKESFTRIVGKSRALLGVLDLVRIVGPTDSTVLIEGETGTGKELIARALCGHSRRKERRFVKMNCASIPKGLLESELFGHEKGAFTGAVSQKIGRLELADQGTLFPDEVGDIPVEIQPKLLRALQEREFERLGSTHTRKVNVRLVAATNRDLEKMVANREFRSDLFYRLNVFPIRIPPLRHRREDIPLLVSYFVQKFAKQMQKKIDPISPAIMTGLTAWQWPGNIRELENFIERAVILTRGQSLEAPISELSPKSLTNNPAENRRQEIMRVLRETKGRVGGVNGAAARMGINRTTLISRMKKRGIRSDELCRSSESFLFPWADRPNFQEAKRNE